MKDLLLYDRSESFNIRDIMRQPHFTYEYKNISELLVEMRDSTFNIAIVLDEYGEMAGLITLEDILRKSSEKSMTNMTSRKMTGSGRFRTMNIS